MRHPRGFFSPTNDGFIPGLNNRRGKRRPGDQLLLKAFAELHRLAAAGDAAPAGQDLIGQLHVIDHPVHRLAGRGGDHPLADGLVDLIDARLAQAPETAGEGLGLVGAVGRLAERDRPFIAVALVDLKHGSVVV